MTESNTTPDNSLPTAASAFPRALLLPFFLLIALLLFSPNFRWESVGPRKTPYGSDFLQEWIGGQIVLSDQRAELYDLDRVHTREHDASNLGFEWQADDYYPMVYPPFHYLLVSPFSQIDYRYAVLLWSLASALAFAATGGLLWRYGELVKSGETERLPHQDSRFAIWMIAMVLFLPWIRCLSMGQKSTFLLLLFTGTFLLLRRGHGFWAGVVFGLVAVKPQLGLLIGAVMILKHRWDFVAGAAMTVGLLVGVSYWIEPTWWSDYRDVVSQMGDYVETAGYQLNDAHSLWGGLKLSLPSLTPGWVKGIAGAGAVVVLGLVAWGMRGPLNPIGARFRFQFSMLMLATVLLSPHFYSYDLTLVLLPLVLIVAEIGFRPSDKLAGWLLGSAIIFFVFAGSFSKMATAVGIQPSLLLMTAMVGMLAIYGRRLSPTPAS